MRAQEPAPPAIAERQRVWREIGAPPLSSRTAMTHVTHILAKPGVASRREAAAVAARDGLV